jgi:digeranylgeranylglycerophospholipid reductase
MSKLDGAPNSAVFTNTNIPPGECYDIVIIGAGPAGLNAGLHAVRATQKLSILLVDTVVPWEQPIQCAEAVGRLGFEEAISVQPSWIRRTITSASFHAPDDTVITYTDKNGGYIIDRAVMQSDCVRELMKNGVTCVFNRRATRISGMERSRRAVSFDDGSTVYGRVVIDASGPIACLGKNEGIAWKPPDLEPAYFVLAEGADGCKADTVHIYMGRDYAPGGYAWMFPRGKGIANIGVLIGSSHRGKANIRSLLDTFLSVRFPGIRVVKRFAGAIPCGFRHGPTAVTGLIKAGDAASTVNPISRAGICEAMLSGGLAGDHALLMLNAGNEREMRRVCASCAKAWDTKRGNLHKKLARVKNSLVQLPDADYNAAARVLARIPQHELTMSTIFRTALGRSPRLVWALRHLM